MRPSTLGVTKSQVYQVGTPDERINPVTGEIVRPRRGSRDARARVGLYIDMSVIEKAARRWH
jgi:hypothetical protein